MPNIQHEEQGCFTAQDRELLITLKVQITHIMENTRDGLARIAKLEADRVTQHDYEGMLTDIDDLRAAKANHSERIGQLEKLVPVVEGLKRQVWMAAGAMGIIFFVARLLLKV